MRKMTMTSWLAIAVLATAGVAEAQITRGGIVGTVRDSSGGLVPGATVSTTNTATNAARTAQTDMLGFFSIEALDPGMYDVVVELAGFTRVNTQERGRADGERYVRRCRAAACRRSLPRSR